MKYDGWPWVWVHMCLATCGQIYFSLQWMKSRWTLCKIKSSSDIFISTVTCIYKKHLTFQFTELLNGTDKKQGDCGELKSCFIGKLALWKVHACLLFYWTWHLKRMNVSYVFIHIRRGPKNCTVISWKAHVCKSEECNFFFCLRALKTTRYIYEKKKVNSTFDHILCTYI